MNSNLTVLRAAHALARLPRKVLAVTPLVLLALAMPQGAQAAANYVYHERTGNNPGCDATAYVPILNPNSGQAHDLRFKVECQFATDRLRVYYTTDGSTPAGAFGVAAGTTTVVSGSYLCTFFDAVPNCTVDVCGATIPSQASGTVVKYIVSAWKDLAGAEIFANSGTCGTCTPADDSSEATVFQYTVASATDLYWDANGATAGAGGATPTGTWGADNFWSGVLDGSAATGAWDSSKRAVFSAGNDATGEFTINVSANQTVAGLVIEEGSVHFTNTAIVVGTGNVTVNSGATLSTDSSLRISATAGATMTVNGGTLRTTNPGAAGTFYDADFAVTLGPGGGTFSHITPNILNIVQTAMTISGPGGLTKTGAGVLAIAGTGAYLGSTTINDGELRIRTTANRLPVGTAVTVNDPGILNLNGVSQQIGSLSGNGRVGLGSGTLMVGDVTDTIFTGSISNFANAGASGVTTGSGRIIKTGTGALTLTGSNAYTGSLTVSNGTVTAAPGSLLCDPIADIVVQGGTLNLSNAAQTVLTLSGSNGTVNLGTGHALTVNPTSGSRNFFGTVAGNGALTKTGGGTLVLVGNNTYEGATTIGAGAIQAASATALGSAATPTDVAGGASVLFDGAASAFTIAEPFSIAGTGSGTLGSAIFVQNNANVVLSGPVTLTGDATIGFSTGTALFDNPTAITALANQNLTLQGGAGAGGGGTISGVISLGTGGLTKLQGGTWTLSAANSYSGPTLVSAGTLRVANTTGSATGTGEVTVSPGASLSGPGSIAGAVVVNGTIAPGASPGTQNTGSETWNGGASYVWEINDADAGQGIDPGWDLVNITGTLTINATSASKFNIDITSLTLANALGNVHDFDNGLDYTWTILKTTGGITGFDVAAFNLLTSNFSNPLGLGFFSLELANGGNDLQIRFNRALAITVQPANQTAECVTGSATFAVTADGIGPFAYQWRFNGGDIGGATAATLTVNPTTPATAGNYDVVVTNNYGAITSVVATLTLADTVPPTITVCAPNQSVNADASCQGAIPDLTGLVTASDTCSAVTLSQSPTAGTLLGVGPHTVTITAKDAANNTATCMATVTINDVTPPTITACAPNQTVTAGGATCQAAIPDLTGMVTSTDTCPGVVTVTQSPLAGSLVSVGTHTVTLTATDVVGNPANCQATVTVNSPVTVTVNSAAICPGGSATLTATHNAASPSYLWSPGGATTDSITVTPASTTIYTVTVTDSATTCAGSGSGTVTVNAALVVTVNSATICPGDSAVLTATTAATSPAYLWSPGGETTASITVSPASTAGYSVTVTDGSGCTGSGSGTVTVRTPDIFANTGAIAINDFAAASPYPSAINVSGLTATVCRVAVTLNNLSHAFPDDIDIVLIAPNGQGVLLISDVGGANAASGITLTLDDSAGGSLPDSAPLASGTYKPTNIGAKSDNRPDNFPAPVPVVNFVTNLSAFAGINPNGAWSLYINDDEPVDMGSLGGGWSIALTTLDPIADLAVAQTPIPNPVGVGSNLTFNITVSNLGPAGANTVSLTDTLPAGMAFVSANASQGSCGETAGVVTCSLGSIAANGSATVTIVVVPAAAGSGNNAVSVTSATLDLVTANNSNSTGVTVLDPPVIVTGPLSQTVCTDKSATFTVTASGAAPLSYQWYLNDVAIGGATGALFSIASAQTADAGTYKVIVSNPVGATQASATLTVNPLPAVTVADVTICVGQSATLTAVTTAASPSYLWSPGGEMTASIIVSPASTTIYTVLVTDGVTGCTNSDGATVTVKALTTATALTSVVDLCPGSSVSFSTTAAGEGPFTYIWRKDGSLLGETSSTLSIAAVTPADAGTYSVEVTGFCNTVTNSATLTVVTPPTITAQPQNQATPMGNGAAFSVTATGVGPITYQWLLNGSPVSGATGTSITVSNVTLAQNGHTYSVIVSNCAGPVTSAAAVLTVTPISGISFDFDTPLQFTNAPYYLTYNNWFNNGFVSPPAVFESALGGTGPFPGSGSLDMPPANGTENTSVLLPVNFDFSLPGKTLYASTMFKVKTPQNNNRRATQMGFVTATNVGINDLNPQGFMTVILQSIATTPVAGWNLRTQRRNSGGGLQESTDFVAPLTLTLSNWYRLNAAFINTKTAGNNTYTIVCSLQDMGPLGTTPGATNATFTTTTNNADIVNFKNVFFALRSFEDGGMEFRDNTYVWTTPGNLFFVQQPQNQTVRQGQRTVFKALVDGEGPYTYQWSRNGSPIPGARSWNYITPPTQTSDSGVQYTVQVTGPANTITSVPATLTVTPETLAVVSAGSVDGTTVGVKFSQPVQSASAENVANYMINGVNPVQARVYRSSLGAQGPDGIYVILTPASILSGGFTVTVSGVQNLSGGAVGAANSASGSVAGLTGFDVNPLVTGPPGENYSFADGEFTVTGGGVDIWNNADSFRFVYTTKAGDFDVKAKIPYMDAVNTSSKAGFDARPSLDPFSMQILAAVNPGFMGGGSGALRQFTEGTYRTNINNQPPGSGSGSWGTSTRVNYPDVWLRFRRAGNTFIRYVSSNGVNWNFDGQLTPSPAFPETVYLGLAVCAVRNLHPESAQFENYGDFGGYAGALITINSQPTDITVSAGSAATIGGLTASVNGGGIPAAGELVYVWQRSDGAGGWTNMPTAGATNNLLAVGTVFDPDDGAQYRAIVMAPGALPVTSSVATLTVTDTAVPTLTSVNAAVLPSYPVSEVILNFSEPLTGTTATDAANYMVTNATGVQLTVLSATFLHGDPRTVILKVDGQLGSGNASVGVSGLRDLNNNTLATTVRTFRSFLPSTGPVVVEVYQDIGGGTAITDLTAHALFTAGTPTYIVYSNLFGFNVVNNFTSSQDNYGVKVYSYFVPPTSGAYKFWIRSDDAMQLFLNTNAVNSTDPAGKVLIAANTGANNNYTVGTTPANSITNITLVGGQSYYMEALLKEGGGGDGFSVTTTAPTVNTAPGTGVFIPTANLAYPSSAAPSTPVVMDIYTGYQNFLPGFNQMAGLTQATNFPTGNYAIDTVNFKYIAGAADVIGYQKYFGVQPVTLSHTRLDNYLGRIQSYFIPPSTGLYRFWMGVDDVAQLYMNTNAINSTDPAGMVRLGQSANAFVSTASQLVAQNVPLVGGQKYYMMALWREGGGGDGIRIAVRPQEDASTPPTTEIIPASMLEYPLAVGRAGAVNFTGIVPANPTVPDGQSITLCAAGIVGAPISAAGSVNGAPYGFIWLKNGVRVLESSITNITPPLTMADNGAVYTLIVTNLFSRMERSVTVTVLADNTAPTVVRTTGWRYGDGFTIQFSEPMDAASATYLGNYQISGGLALLGATLDPTRTMVSIPTSPQAMGATYTVTLNGVKDASSAGNAIAANTVTMFSTWAVGGSGFLVELFTNIVGTAIADLAGTPKFSANLPDVVYYTNVFGVGTFAANSGLENYGARVSGYFIPTSTGLYRFYLRSDDSAQLWMNINGTDSENPAGRTMLIHNINANLNINDPKSISAPIPLNQGQRYYIEALLKEGGGGDYVQVTFRQTDENGTSLTPVPVDNTVNENSTIASFGGAGVPGNPDAIQILQTPPSDVFVVENELVSLSLVASIPANILRAVSYQWQKFDGAAYTNIPGATASTLSFFANLSDNLAKYRLVFSAPGRNASYLTTLHVSPDTQPPFIVSASSLDGRTIGLCFNERLYTTNAIDSFNYTVNGGAINVSAAEQRADLRSVILYVDPPVSGVFTVRADFQRDMATPPNEGSSTTNGIVQGFTPMDIGAPVAAGSSFSCLPGEIDVIAGGSDIWGNSDVGHLTLSLRSGDFDIHARVQSLTPADPAQPSISKAGLMIRQTLDANSTTIYHSVNPPPPRGRDLGEVGQRTVIGGGTALFAGSASYTPVGIPNAWIRAQRRGDTFTFFRSSDGLSWIQVASGSTAFSSQVFIGLATTAHTATQVPGLTTFAEYRNIYIPNPPTILVQPSPTSQTVALGASVTYSVVVSNPPNSGPLIYQWRRNGVAISGATSGTLTLDNLTEADSGSYVVQAGNDGGATVSDAVTLAVSNATILTGASYSGGIFSAFFQTAAGFNYTIEYKNNLNDPGWTTLTVIAGDGTLKSFNDPGPLPSMRFYRVSASQ